MASISRLSRAHRCSTCGARRCTIGKIDIATHRSLYRRRNTTRAAMAVPTTILPVVMASIGCQTAAMCIGDTGRHRGAQQTQSYPETHRQIPSSRSIRDESLHELNQSSCIYVCASILAIWLSSRPQSYCRIHRQTGVRHRRQPSGCRLHRHPTGTSLSGREREHGLRAIDRSPFRSVALARYAHRRDRHRGMGGRRCMSRPIPLLKRLTAGHADLRRTRSARRRPRPGPACTGTIGLRE